VIFPPAVRPGDTVAVIAPSSPFEAVLAFRGMAFLRGRYKVVFDRGMFTRCGYLAGNDARRAEELERALVAPEVRAIVAVRGGYGASRFVHEVDWARVAADPKWFVGFSDITAIHLELARVGVASIHAPHVTSLGRGDACTRDGFVRALETPLSVTRFAGLRSIATGAACGPIVGGNLTLIHAAAAAGRLALPAGAILFIEDVTERPYRIDRMLTTLMVGNHLKRIAGVVAGDFTSCDPGPDGVTVADVLADRLTPLRVPVLSGLPAGHGTRNVPIVLGATAKIDSSGLELATAP